VNVCPLAATAQEEKPRAASRAFGSERHAVSLPALDKKIEHAQLLPARPIKNINPAQAIV
jgi:hypothetical protein